MSQATVGGLMGTSQSAVARIESAQENITLGTLRRLITALRGRFQVSITPEEVQLPQWPVWWEMMDAGLSATTPYVLKGVALQDDGHTRRVGAGWESQEETSAGPLLIEAKAS